MAGVLGELEVALSRITVVPGEDEILNDYPYLEKADFPAIYAYASRTGRERKSRCS